MNTPSIRIDYDHSDRHRFEDVWSQFHFNLPNDPFNFGGVIPQYLVGYNGVTTTNPLEDVAFPGGSAATDFGTATSILSILTGPVAQGTQTFNAATPTSGFVPGQIQQKQFRNRNLGGYVGDSYRFRENLTLNLGVRYEFISVPKDIPGLTLLPRGGALSVLDPDAVIDFAPGGGRPLFNNDFNNFAPTASFAWDPLRAARPRSAAATASPTSRRPETVKAGGASCS